MIFVFAYHLLLVCSADKVKAQKIQYSSENVAIDYPYNFQLVANIGSNHHLLKFVRNANPVVFIFNKDLKLKMKISIPLRYPDNAEIRIIPFAKFYYLSIHRFNQNNLLWKIDSDGNFTDLSVSFQKLLASQSRNFKLGVQLIANQEQLWMVCHTNLNDPEKNTIVIVQADSLLNTVFEHKVTYNFKRELENLKQENLMFGRYLLVLKGSRNGTSLELMKVNLATGYTISNTFSSSGYIYSQPAFNYNHADTSVTVSALLTEPITNSEPRQFVFLSRSNKILVEEVPFSILKKQFIKKARTNFLLVDGMSKWVRLFSFQAQNRTANIQNSISLYRDLTMPDPNNQIIRDNNRLFEKIDRTKSASFLEDKRQDIRFTLLDNSFKTISDSVVSNSKNSYTIRANQFTQFTANNKEYLLVGQQYFNKSNGLLLVNTNGAHQLIYTDLIVKSTNEYLLSKSRAIPEGGIIVPYTNKREVGLIKITLDDN